MQDKETVSDDFTERLAENKVGFLTPKLQRTMANFMRNGPHSCGRSSRRSTLR